MGLQNTLQGFLVFSNAKNVNFVPVCWARHARHDDMGVIYQLAKQVMDRKRSALEEAAYTLVVCGKDSRAFVGEELHRNQDRQAMGGSQGLQIGVRPRLGIR